MAINLKLGDVRRVRAGEKDPMGRTWVGYDPANSPELTFDQNRGVWRLNLARAMDERFATLSHKGRIKVVAEIESVEVAAPGSPKRVLVGRVLKEGHPAYDYFMDRPVGSTRQPVSYIEDPEPRPRQSPRLCRCGCGGPVAGDRNFISGHDQRAVHERIREHWGGTVSFIDWFDATYRSERRAA